MVFQLVLLTGVQAEAAPDNASPGASAQKVPVFYVSQVWPWGYAKSETDDTPMGMLPEFARRLSRISGVPLQIELRPHRRVIADLARGKSGFVVLFESDKPSGSAIDLGRLAAIHTVLINDRHQAKHPLSLKNLRGKSLAFVNGTVYGEGFDDNDAVRRVPVRDLRQAMALLRVGRIDGFIASDQAFFRTLRTESLEASDFNITQIGQVRVAHLYMDRTAPWSAAAEKLKAAVKIMRESGELNEIFFLPPEITVKHKN